ncbi:MAG: hypothetical protein ACOYJ2_08810 [Rickettsiales bacterium]
MKLTDLQESPAEDIAEYLRDIAEHPECAAVHKAVVRRALERGMYVGPHDLKTNLSLLDTEDGFEEVIEHDVNGSFVFAQMYDGIAAKIATDDYPIEETPVNEEDGLDVTPDDQLAVAALKALDVCYPKLHQKEGQKR